MVLHVLPRRPALEHPGGAGEEADLVDGVAASPRVAVSPSGLPVFLHSTRDELVDPLLDGVGDLEQRLLAARDGVVSRHVSKAFAAAP